LKALRHILGHRFRANPAFELVARDQLPEPYRADLVDGTPGVALIPRLGGPVTVKILNARAAALVRGLEAAGGLPDDVVKRGGPAANEAVARLVLDAALEIADGDRLISGPAAHGAVFDRGARVPAAGRLATLSTRAIRYGQCLMIYDVELLSRRLYSFGTIPRRAGWERVIDAADDVIGPLGLSRDGRARQILSENYQSSTLPNWLSWSLDHGPSELRPDLRYKLYISPRPEALIGCFPAIAAVLADLRVRSFKLGRGVPGLLRPDKLVAYFETLKHLRRVAGALASRLAKCPSQGVPFSAELSADGLLSWGVDPPPNERPSGAGPQESWRYWVSNRLASGLVHAQAAAGTGVEPWEYALDRLSLEGVDPLTWLPDDMGRSTTECI
jgi:hypothetical protein